MANFNDSFVIVDLGIVAMPLPDSGTTGLDTISPVLTISPEDGPLQRDDVVTVDISDNREVVLVTVFNGDHVIYDGSHFTPAYELSTIEYRENGGQINIRCMLGWKAGPVSIEAMAIDARGNLRRATAMFEGTVPTPASCVNSVFGRFGPHVRAADGDYRASQISNDSAVSGTSVADAQDVLAAEAMTRVVVAADLDGTPSAPRVAGIQGRVVQDVVPSDGSVLTWSAANNRWEPKPVVQLDTFWTTLYEPNLPAWGAANLGPVGDHVNVTIEGATWRPFGEYGNAMGAGTAQGLKLKGSNRRWDIEMVYPVAPYWFLDLHTIAGFDEAKDTLILARFISSDGTLGAGHFVGVSSVVDDVSSNCGYMAASHLTAQIQQENGKPTRMRRVTSSSGGEPTYDVYTTTIATNTHADYCVGILRRVDRTGLGLYGRWIGTFPPVERLIPIAGTVAPTYGTLAQLGAAFIAGNSYSTTPDWILTHAKVLQRPVT